MSSIPEQEPTVLSSSEAAGILGVHHSRVRQMRQEGKIKPYEPVKSPTGRIVGWRYEASEVQRVKAILDAIDEAKNAMHAEVSA